MKFRVLFAFALLMPAFVAGYGKEITELHCLIHKDEIIEVYSYENYHKKDWPVLIESLATGKKKASFKLSLGEHSNKTLSSNLKDPILQKLFLSKSKTITLESTGTGFIHATIDGNHHAYLVPKGSRVEELRKPTWSRRRKKIHMSLGETLPPELCGIIADHEGKVAKFTFSD
ncbi:hypothetical protein ACFLY6_00680, partial [Candidatus Dependentiae bacterium]